MAEVFNIWTNTDGRYQAALSHDFDPETDAVIVVKKDAARVWIEESGVDGQWIHTKSQPRAEQRPLRLWHSTSSAMQTMNDATIDGLVDGDLVEFVAIKTHRPPVAQEVTEPVKEAVPELSDEAKVKAVYPEAIHGCVSKCIKSGIDFLSESFSDPVEAWADAARRLEAKRKTVAENTITRLERFTNSLEHLGCGVEVVSGAVLAN